MANEEQNPFGVQSPLAGMAHLAAPKEQQQSGVPQQFVGGMDPGEGGSAFQLDPAVMQMLWAPRNQATQPPPPQIQPPPPQINPY